MVKFADGRDRARGAENLLRFPKDQAKVRKCMGESLAPRRKVWKPVPADAQRFAANQMFSVQGAV